MFDSPVAPLAVEIEVDDDADPSEVVELEPWGSPAHHVTFAPPKPNPTGAPPKLKHSQPPPALASDSGENTFFDLQHFSFGCPGFTGPGTRMNVEPIAFRRLFSEVCKIEIPLFQRKYCWTEKQGTKWFCDAMAETKKEFSNKHGVGKIVLKKNEDGQWLCIDGQQRIVTCAILIAAIRDTALKQLKSQSASNDFAGFLDSLDGMLFTNIGAAREFAQRVACSGLSLDSFLTSEVGWDEEWKHVRSFCRVHPSYADRHQYLVSICDGLVRHYASGAAQHRSSFPQQDDSAPRGDLLLSIKTLFDRMVTDTSDAMMGSRSGSVLSVLEAVTQRAVDEMYLMLVDVLTPINYPQVFLWLQEKSLFGFGALLQNLAPGVTFTASDLVRNLLLAPTMDMSRLEQENFHREFWLVPLELEVGGPQKMDKLLELFLHANEVPVVRHSSVANEDPTELQTAGRHCSTFERQIQVMTNRFSSAGVLKYSTAGIHLYARFCSYVEAMVKLGSLQSEMIDGGNTQKAETSCLHDLCPSRGVSRSNNNNLLLSITILRKLANFRKICAETGPKESD